jgi:hypothetical protein
MRKLCTICKRKPVAINYVKEGRVFYRSKCDSCARGSKSLRPKWQLTGYKKSNRCDKCGYTNRYSEVFDVYHIDGDLNNCRITNLKTVCANCQRILLILGLPWKQGDLTPDL